MFLSLCSYQVSPMVTGEWDSGLFGQRLAFESHGLQGKDPSIFCFSFHRQPIKIGDFSPKIQWINVKPDIFFTVSLTCRHKLIFRWFFVNCYHFFTLLFHITDCWNVKFRRYFSKFSSMVRMQWMKNFVFLFHVLSSIYIYKCACVNVC